MKALAPSLADDGMLQRFHPVHIKRIGRWKDIDKDRDLDDILGSVATAISDCELTKSLFRFSPEADVELCKVEDFKKGNQ